ncbi:MAG: hypothetical protein ACNS60_20385 [Candidatus Cyclobacteriaceae bacterium M2_1C_046]
MSTYLANRSIVLVGVFNPLLFDRYFFIKNQMVVEEDIKENTFSVAQLSQLMTTHFQLVVHPNQIIITPFDPQNKLKVGIDQVIIKIVDALPESKITASGMNFVWLKEVEEGNLNSVTKELFFNENNLIQKKYFEGNDCHFGFYSSKNIKNCRLKLDVKPVLNNQNSKHSIQYQFNFHRDYPNPDENNSEIISVIKNYSDFWDESIKIINIK